MRTPDFCGTFRGIVTAAGRKEQRLMGTLYERKGSSFYWADYVDTEGIRQRVSTGTADKKEAEDFLKIREGKVAEGVPVSPRIDRITFNEVRDNLLRHYDTSGDWK